MKFIYLTLSLSLSYIHELYTPLITWFLVGLVSLGHQIILQAKISICTNIYSFGMFHLYFYSNIYNYHTSIHLIIFVSYSPACKSFRQHFNSNV